jgi:flagellar L-ring protein precursor FlgH
MNLSRPRSPHVSVQSEAVMPIARIQAPPIPFAHSRESRESGNPGQPADAIVALGPRFRGDERKKHTARIVLAMLSAALLAGCSAIDRFAEIGSPPSLSAIDNPITQPGYRPVHMPMPEPMPAAYNPNSLWRSGSRAFFKDQRAHQVGDILTVKVKITDKATIDNETKRSRKSEEEAAVNDLLGLSKVPIFKKVQIPGTLVSTDSTANSEGKGSVNRSEDLQTNVAAVVTQVLPNGNMVIEGRQEIRVNFELRELVVGGIVRPEDIEADNTIASTKIAQARIAYGGRGQITDVQQPRYGQQVLDIILPW